MRLSKSGIAQLKAFEGLSLGKYRDVAGFGTIGYGHFIQASEEIAETITEAEADRLLLADVQIAECAVNKLVKVPLSQNQFDALVLFVFNIGKGAFKDSTLLKQLNQSNYEIAADEFLRWNKASINGVFREIEGLTRRRKQEREMFLLKPVL